MIGFQQNILKTCIITKYNILHANTILKMMVLMLTIFSHNQICSLIHASINFCLSHGTWAKYPHVAQLPCNSMPHSNSVDVSSCIHSLVPNEFPYFLSCYLFPQSWKLHLWNLWHSPLDMDANHVTIALFGWWFGLRLHFEVDGCLYLCFLPTLLLLGCNLTSCFGSKLDIITFQITFQKDR